MKETVTINVSEIFELPEISKKEQLTLVDFNGDSRSYEFYKSIKKSFLDYEKRISGLQTENKK